MDCSAGCRTWGEDVAENLTVESPEFDRIKKESGPATRDAVQLLWFVANNESAERRRGVRAAQEEDIAKTLAGVPTADLHNFDTQGSPVIVFTGTANVTMTGISNGVQGQLRS